MAHNRNFDIDQVENGFKIRILVPSSGEGGEFYGEPTEMVATTKEQVMKLFAEWLDGNDSPTVDSNTDPNNSTTLGSTSRLDRNVQPPGQGIHLTGTPVR